MRSTDSATTARSRRILLAFSGTCLLLAAVPARAVDIQPVYNANVTAQQRAVIEAKIALWEARLPHQSPEHVVTITFANGNLGSLFFFAPPGVEYVRAESGELRAPEGATLGQTTNFTNDANGRPTGATITMNNNAAISWYTGLDPNVPAGQYDYYTVINHEMAHALGFTVNNPRFARNVTTTPNPVDPNLPPEPNAPRRYNGGGPSGTPGATLTPSSSGTHTDPNSHPGDLMNPTIPKGTRRTPSETDIGVLLDDVWNYPTIQGSLSNFDVWNRSGMIANDFMVTLGGVLSSSIRSIYNGESCPFPNGHTESTAGGTVVKWGPGPGQVNPGQKAHFGFKIAGDLTPLSYTFQWTQNNEVISTVPVSPGTWRSLTGDRMATPIRHRVTNNNSAPVWVFRRMNFSMVPIALDDLLLGMPLDMTATPIDLGPVLLPPQGSITYDFYGVPDGTWGVVMITDYIEDMGGVPGMLLGTWLDAVQLMVFVMPGDTNCDGIVSYGDINPFVIALGGQTNYDAQYPDCDWLSADCNGDGTVNYGDINAFVLLLNTK